MPVLTILGALPGIKQGLNSFSEATIQSPVVRRRVTGSQAQTQSAENRIPDRGIDSSARAQPRATQVKESSAMLTGRPVSSISNRSISRNRTPPPALDPAMRPVSSRCQRIFSARKTLFQDYADIERCSNPESLYWGAAGGGCCQIGGMRTLHREFSP